MIRYISIIFFLAVFSGAYAQESDSIRAKSNAQIQDSIIKGLKAKKQSSVTQKQDSLKKPRILREWTLSDDFSQEIDTRIDTAFSLVNRHRKADKYSPVNAGLGNYGLPFYQLNFFDRITDPDEFLYSSYYPLMHLNTNSIFMNTQGPFTNLEWTFAGQRETSEQTFRVMHSQNINR